MDKQIVKFIRIKICDLPVDCITMDEAVEVIVNNIQSKRKTIIFTPNVDHIVKAKFDREFKEIYSHVDLSLVDGMPLVWISGIYGKKLPERINGTNLIIRLCKTIQEKNFSLFLLGPKEEILKLAVGNIKKTYPGLDKIGYRSIPFENLFNYEESLKVINEINKFKPDILLLGFGPPHQEKWIYRYYNFLDAYIFIGVGSTFDFLSKKKKRAPIWMQNLGLEWLFRLIQEPRRLWKRYIIGNTIFLFLLLKDALIIFIKNLNILNLQRCKLLSMKFRKKRIDFFKSFISSLPRPLKILDIGGSEDFWFNTGFYKEKDIEIWILNLIEIKTTHSNFKSLIGDARDLKQFKDKEFDVIFSNSVIEHLGSYSDQSLMANEVRRLGERYFLQTPNRYFPIEPHFLFPFFQFFPYKLKIWLVTHFNLGWFGKIPDENKAREIISSIRLLNKKELKILFPESKIKEEKFLGLTKSFIVYR